MAKRKLEVVLTGDAKKLNSTLGSVEGKLNGFGSKFKTFAGGMAAGVASAFAVHKIADFGSQLFSLGQSLEVMAIKAGTVFEGSLGAVEKWAKGTAASMGLADEQLVGLAANFGDLLKPMGFTADEAATMSTEVLDLSGALAAWSGGQYDAAQVSEILAKAMLGEREQLKSLGIAISEADVQAKLAAKGQDDLTGAALAQAEALATQELLFEKSTDAQKAWTDGSMDNLQAQNELKAVWEEIQVALASKFLPAVQTAFGWIRDNVVPIVQGAMAAFDEGGLGGALSYVADQWSQAWPQIQEALMGVLGSMFSTVQEWVQGGGIGDALEGLGAAIADVLGLDPERFREGWENFKAAWDDLINGEDGLKARWTSFGDWLEEETGITLDDFGEDWDRFWERFERGRQKVEDWLGGPEFFDRLGNNFAAVAEFIGLGIEAFVKGVEVILKGVWWLIEGIWGVVQMVGDAIGFLIDQLQTAKSWLDTVTGSFGVGLPDSGFFNFGFPGIPGIMPLAEGGIVTSPTLAMIGEGGEPEAVIPLSKMAGMGGPQVIHLEMDGQTLATWYTKGQRSAELAGMA